MSGRGENYHCHGCNIPDSISEDVRLNRALWALAGKMAELKGESQKVSEPQVIEAEFVEAA